MQRSLFSETQYGNPMKRERQNDLSPDFLVLWGKKYN